ncbi:amidohydrolase family protein [Sphingomonas sp. AP4-R1]|uniref:amidohydrolase family protein n=1 Tax=Sphingomonas sp. AP4-R1 TaxID=2735134 RepID=UPI0014939553|nr:amidohydrolase family protein [Sphingomonas sp. AP4-R1]QJU57881.1 amidohydrolase family protein [Sphingomonas sp. AP4-R1]
MSTRSFAAFAAALLASVPAFAATPSGVTAIVGATIFDGTGTAPYAGTVTLFGDRILAVGPSVKPPRGAKIVDARGKALLPGFFDVHTHWTPAGLPGTTPQIANAYVKLGVTTVNDFNDQPESFAPRREWLSQLASPHVLFAARISTPGGHGADWADEATTIAITTPEGGRAAIRSLIPYKPDLIKVFNDGWRYGTMPNNNNVNENALAAVVVEAHKQNWPVLTHTVTVERGLEAARAGVDSLAHGLQDRKLTADEVAAIRKSGMAMAPTLAVYEPVKPGQPARAADDPRLAVGRARFATAFYNVKTLHDAGVPIALGTDAGMPGTPHGSSSLHEMELLVQAGLTPTDALLSGTSVSAHLMRVDQDRGTIAAGKRADIVLVDGTPWAKISDVFKTWQVYIDGRLVSGAGAPALPALNRTDRLPSVTVPALVDDFERPDGRSGLDTLRITDPDGGLDRSIEVAEVITREGGGHALSMTAKMSQKANPYAGVVLPLTRGSIKPVNLSHYQGVRFEIRGKGSYRLRLNGLDGSWSAPVTVTGEWQGITIPFASLRPAGGEEQAAAKTGWTGDGITQIEVGGNGPAGERIWMMLDNVTLY